jgi:magnesium transporter
MMLKLPANGDAEGRPAFLWIDLLDPTEIERQEAEAVTGFVLPTRDGLSEIESSSRLRSRDGTLILSTPMIVLSDASHRGLSPIGFMLSRQVLVTMRFSPHRAFQAVATRFDTPSDAPTCSLDVFVTLCEEMVDRMADALEGVAAALNDLSTAIFSTENAKGREAVRASRRLRDQIRQVGQMGGRSSNTRDALVGLGRILGYVGDMTKDWGLEQIEPRLTTLRQDVTSLNDYEVHLSDKIQFLLDALVGMIGITQNDIFKFLTIVSIVGIPPTVVAGIYGMNFKVMPELSWALGYPYGVAMIALSAIIPLIWFKLRGWF